MESLQNTRLWRIFLYLYVFYVLNTVITPMLVKRLIVIPHEAFCLQLTARLYQAFNASLGSVHATQSTQSGFHADSLSSYLWIVVHNALLPIIAVAFFVIALVIPHVKVAFIRPILEYVRTLSVLFFFAFALVVLVMNAVLIPFVIATVSVALPAHTLAISTALLVHGSVEYAALSLVVAVPVLALRRYIQQKRLHGVTLRQFVRQYGLFRGYLVFWYRSVVSEDSMGAIFLRAMQGFRRRVFQAYSLSIGLFAAAALIETFVSPEVQALLIHTT